MCRWAQTRLQSSCACSTTPCAFLPSNLWWPPKPSNSAVRSNRRPTWRLSSNSTASTYPSLTTTPSWRRFSTGQFNSLRHAYHKYSSTPRHIAGSCRPSARHRHGLGHELDSRGLASVFRWHYHSLRQHGLVPCRRPRYHRRPRRLGFAGFLRLAHTYNLCRQPPRRVCRQNPRSELRGSCTPRRRYPQLCRCAGPYFRRRALPIGTPPRPRHDGQRHRRFRGEDRLRTQHRYRAQNAARGRPATRRTAGTRCHHFPRRSCRSPQLCRPSG